RFGAGIERHALRREIVATSVSNLVVNRAGTSFLYRLADETQADLPAIARSYLAASAMFQLPAMGGEIVALDGEVRATRQIAMLPDLRQLADRATRWLLTRRPQPIDLSAEVERFAPRIVTLDQRLPTFLVGDDLRRYDEGVDTMVRDEVPYAL